MSPDRPRAKKAKKKPAKKKAKKPKAKKPKAKKSPSSDWEQRRKIAINLGVLMAALLVGYIAGRWSGTAPGSGPHMEYIQRWSREYNVDPDLAAAVVHAESSGRPRAVSHSGALGLMQLMPPTAAEAASELGLPTPSREDLFNPELNTRLGIYYLSKLRRRFGDQGELVIAAYHAGPTRVDQWRRSRTDLSAAQIVEKLAFPQTRKYVRRVMYLWKRNATGKAAPPRGHLSFRCPAKG